MVIFVVQRHNVTPFLTAFNNLFCHGIIVWGNPNSTLRDVINTSFIWAPKLSSIGIRGIKTIFSNLIWPQVKVWAGLKLLGRYIGLHFSTKSSLKRKNLKMIWKHKSASLTKCSKCFDNKTTKGIWIPDTQKTRNIQLQLRLLNGIRKRDVFVPISNGCDKMAAILSLQPFKIRPSKCLVFEWIRFLNGRISDPYCIQIMNGLLLRSPFE